MQCYYYTNDYHINLGIKTFLDSIQFSNLDQQTKNRLVNKFEKFIEKLILEEKGL